MADTIDKATADYETWLFAQTHRPPPPPNDTTECIDCGGEIGEKRKQAVSYAVRCIVCQAEFERGKQ